MESSILILVSQIQDGSLLLAATLPVEQAPFGEMKGLGFEEAKVALDGLLEADLVVWEAGGENHIWRISSGGRDYLTSSRE